MTSEKLSAFRAWSEYEDQYILARPGVSDKQIGVELNRSRKSVNGRRWRLKQGVVGGRRVRTPASIEKFNATMAAKREETRAGIEMRSAAGWPQPTGDTWDALLKGRVFGAPVAGGTSIKVLRVSYVRSSLVGCAAAMCADVG